MGSFRTPKQRLPDHLKHLSKGPSGQGRAGPAPDSRPPAPPAHAAPPAAAGPDRLSELLPLVLRAMVGDAAARSPEERPIWIRQDAVLAALVPYHRPRSRFEDLMVRKLVGEGYLRPRGARDKSGLSAAYTLTPKGEQLLGLRSSP